MAFEVVLTVACGTFKLNHRLILLFLKVVCKKILDKFINLTINSLWDILRINNIKRGLRYENNFVTRC